MARDQDPPDPTTITRILDVASTGIDQTVPTYVGNKDPVDWFRARF